MQKESGTEKEKEGNDRKVLLQVSWVSACLGAMFGMGFCGWLSISPSTLSPYPLYLAAVAAFHLFEYLAMTASHDPNTLSSKRYRDIKHALDAFLLDNGREYLYSLIVPAFEFALEHRLFPSLKTLLIFRTIRFIGILMIISGQVLRIWAIMTAGPAFTHLVASSCSPTHQLVTNGPYAFMRHPGYAGFFVWAVGLQLCLGNPGTLALFVHILIPFFEGRIKDEERALLERFGSEYLAYRRRTRSGLLFVE